MNMRPMVPILAAVLAACTAEDGAETRRQMDSAPAAYEPGNPILGAWELVRGEYTDPDGTSTVRDNGGPVQIKIFTDGHFAYVGHTDAGGFLHAGAGSYVLSADRYVERHRYQSDHRYVDHTAEWRFRLDGDTLYMEGPTQVLDATGTDITDQVARMHEKRVRAR